MPRTAILVASAFALLGVGFAAENPGPSPERIAKLIGQLGSPKFAEREAASKSLDAVGEPATAALQAAANVGDAETRSRASEILKRIERRALVARILKPTTIALDFDNTPLSEAVATLAKQSGVIERPTYSFPANRKVTVKSAPLPIWEAVELFCRKADLHEWDPSAPLPNGAAQTTHMVGPGNIVRGAAIQGQIVINGAGVPVATAIHTKAPLLDGPGANLPTYHAGALRLRLLPAGTPFPVSDPDATLLPLHISAEPHMQFGGILGLQIDKAVDDQGVPLQSSGVIAPLANGEAMAFVAMPNGGMRAQPIGGRSGVAAVRIARNDKSSKSIRLISGEASAQVHITEALARIAGPLKAGAVVAGSAGTQLKISDCTTPADGRLRLTIELALPPDLQAAGAAGANGARIVAQGGLVFQQQVVFNAHGEPSALPSGTTEFVGLSLEDAQGRLWAATNGQQESIALGPDGLTIRLHVIFKPPAPDAAAARLIFRGTRPMVIAVPFRFQDVPLP
jgi:hypothetical protein